MWSKAFDPHALDTGIGRDPALQQWTQTRPEQQGCGQSEQEGKQRKLAEKEECREEGDRQDELAGDERGPAAGMNGEAMFPCLHPPQPFLGCFQGE